MDIKREKAATEKISGESVQTNAAELFQQQPSTVADGTTAETASGGAGTEAAATTTQSITASDKTETSVALQQKFPDITDLQRADWFLSPVSRRLTQCTGTDYDWNVG
jgi:hypothetical protein